MAIEALTISESDIVSGQKIYSTLEKARIAEIEAWALTVSQQACDLGTAQTITAVKRFSASPLVPTLATSDDSTQAASTAFVQDRIGSSITSNVESVTLPTGVIIKSNTVSPSTNPQDVTFAEAFTVGCVPKVFVCLAENLSTPYAAMAYGVTNEKFTYRCGSGAYDFTWFAIGY